MNTKELANKPMINIIHNFIGARWAMGVNQVFFHPGNQVILKCTFDHLVEKVGCNKFMNIGSWKVIRKGLIIN
jgi:hypothetical protein